MRKQTSCSERVEELVPPPWNGIAPDTRQAKPCSCAYTVLQVLGKIHGRTDEEWEASFRKLGKSAGIASRMLGHSMDEADILSMLAWLKIPNELLKPDPGLLDARLAAGDAIICSFEQYTSGYVKSLLQKARMAVKSRSEHSVLIVAKTGDGYLAFDPGWARGGWQVLTYPVMKRILADAMNTFIGVAPPGRSATRLKAEDGYLFVNGHNGHWVYGEGETLDEGGSEYLFRQEEIVLPFLREQVYAPTQYVVNVTNRCNLGCRYCYVDSLARGEDMSPACFRRVVEAAYVLSRKQPISVILHGGEPLLVLRDYEETLEELKGSIPGLQLSLQTSAVDLTDDLLRIIEKFQIQVGVSLDGPEKIHDAQRSGFRRTMEVLASFKRHRLFSGTITTLTKMSCRQMADILDFLVGNEFYSIAFSPVVATGRGARFADLSPDAEDLAEAYVVAWERLLSYRAQGLPVTMREFSQMLVSLVSNIRPTVCGYTPCAACKHLLGVDVNGDAYVCDMLIGDPRFSLGPLSTLDEGAVSAKFPDGPFARDAPDYVTGCNQCHWRKTCMRGCPSNNISFGTQGRPSRFCGAFRRILERMAYDVSTSQVADDYVRNVAMAGLKDLDLLEERTVS